MFERRKSIFLRGALIDPLLPHNSSSLLEPKALVVAGSLTLPGTMQGPQPRIRHEAPEGECKVVKDTTGC